MMPRLLLVLLFLIIPYERLYCGTTDPQISDNKYVEYGKKFECVGKLCGKYDDNTPFCASAVAIDNHNIITAAHVVKGSTSCFFYVGDTEFCIKQFIIHKDFNDQNFGMADIAIGYSEESFNLNFYPQLYSENDEVDKICSIAGYGFHGTFKTGAKFHDNKKRAGSNIIEDIQYNLLICSPSKIGDSKRTSLEFMIASGDSGGGLFIDSKLAGINSCIMAVDKAPSSKYNEESGHTRISKFIEWINANKHK